MENETSNRRDILTDWANQKADPELKGSLGEALYSMSESGVWPDNVSRVSRRQAIMCWKIIERLRTEEFPENLSM